MITGSVIDFEARTNLLSTYFTQVSALACFKQLSTIHLYVHVQSWEAQTVQEDLNRLLSTPPPAVSEAKRLLSKQGGNAPKTLEVIYKVRDFEEARPHDYVRRWKVGSRQRFDL